MKPRKDRDDGPFPQSVFPESVFPRRIFPWMGGDDEDEDEDSDQDVPGQQGERDDNEKE